jgi:Tol biopolymer transport system component
MIAVSLIVCVSTDGEAQVNQKIAAGGMVVLGALAITSAAPAAEPGVESSLEIYNLATGARRVVLRIRDHIEAPNWSRDGSRLIFNAHGHLFWVPVTGGQPEIIDTGKATTNNNDHGLSPDGKFLAISDQSSGPSLVHVVPLAGGEPRQVTAIGPSYWHGWSPDGRRLAFVGMRPGGDGDIYSIAVEGGAETRLTSAPGLDDGPDYAPNGMIYFNSERSGGMQIWKMNADGSDQRRVTHDPAFGDWFPHPSPDGRWVVFLSFDGAVKGHPPNKEVSIRLIPLDESQPPRALFQLFGGQGTINVPSWSPDSAEFAFVSYKLLDGTP